MAGCKRSRSEHARPEETLTTLPDDMIFHEISPWLDPKAICALATTCRAFWARRSQLAEAWFRGRLTRGASHDDIWADLRAASRLPTGDWFLCQTACGISPDKPWLHNPTDITYAGPKDGGPPILWFSLIGRTSVVRALLDRGADVNADGSIALIAAVANGFQGVVQLLLDRGANVNARKAAPLSAACANGNLEMARLLLDRGADVNAYDSRALHWTLRVPRLAPVIQLLVDRGARVTGVLEYDVVCGNRDAVRMLLPHAARSDVLSVASRTRDRVAAAELSAWLTKSE